MPRLSEQRRLERRRHVLVSAWRCFAREGFHATTMDDVIAEAGWSASAVYRYVSGKDDLIAAAAEESLALLGSVAVDLAGRRPVPAPREAVAAFVQSLREATASGDYDLAPVVVQTWTEALRNPRIADAARASFDQARRRLTRLATAWRHAGQIPGSVRPSDVASSMLLLIPGLVLDSSVLGGRSTQGLLAVLGAWDPDGPTRRVD